MIRDKIRHRKTSREVLLHIIHPILVSAFVDIFIYSLIALQLRV